MVVLAHVVDPLVVQDVSIRFSKTEQGVNTYGYDSKRLSSVREADDSSIVLDRDEFISSLLIPRNTEHHIAVLRYLVDNEPP